MNGIVVKPVMPRAQRHGVKVAGPASHARPLSLMMHFRRDTRQTINPAGNAAQLCHHLQIVTLAADHRPSAMP